MNRTPIEWTHWSVNPLKMMLPNGDLVNVCVHKSEGCRHCYAESIVRHFWKKSWLREYGDFPGYTPALLKLGKPHLDEKELEAVLRLSRRIEQGKADPQENRVFWNDMTDEGLDFWPDEFLDKLWAVRALTPNLIHQVLTKRIERMHSYFASFQESGATERALRTCAWVDRLTGFTIDVSRPLARIPSGLPNAHLGVSVEDEPTAIERISKLLATPAAVRWVSYEPALAAVDFEPHIWPQCIATREEHDARHEGGMWCDERQLDWIVVGGESGPGARPFDIQWARNTIAQCKAAGVPVFVKQLGARPVDGSRMSLDSDRLPLRLKDKKGGDWNEWPEDLRIREYPNV